MAGRREESRSEGDTGHKKVEYREEERSSRIIAVRSNLGLWGIGSRGGSYKLPHYSFAIAKKYLKEEICFN